MMYSARFHRRLLLLLCFVIPLGCTRTQYRMQADREAYEVIDEHAYNPKYAAPTYNIDVDPRSRYHEIYNQDCPPMPEDDPESHRYMHEVHGIKGWKHWDDFGYREHLTNPVWQERMREYVDVAQDGTVRLTPEAALRLLYVHSPNHQNQLETMYLSAIDVITERFRLETQFFGGYDVAYRHVGNKRAGGETNTLTVGRGSGAIPLQGAGGGSAALQLNRRFATAGELVIGLANSFVWEFTQGDVNFASSLLSASFVQPLLRNAGKDVALEQLTIVERALLANVRQYYLYRQGLYTQVNIGDLGVGGLQRRGGFFGGTGLTGFTGQGAGGFGGVGVGTFGGGGFFGGGGGGGQGAGFAGGGAGTVGGYLGLLQQIQQIRNTEDSLRLQLRTLTLLEAHREAGVISLTQVDQFRQSIETERANLLSAQNALKLSQEGFLTGTLGLPPDLPVDLDDSMIKQFQLVAPKATSARNEIAVIKDRVGDLPDDAALEEVQAILQEITRLIDVMRGQFLDVETDLNRMDQVIPQRTDQLTDTEQRLLDGDVSLLKNGQETLKSSFDELINEFEGLQGKLDENNRERTVRDLVAWLNEFYRLSQGSILVQARARLEAVTVEPITITSGDAYRIAVDNRIDLKNGRAALVDSWRLIAFNADALQSNVSISFSGNMGTIRDNAINFDGSNSTVTAGIQFDAPFTRVLERNNYRQQLITYQRSRRGFIQAYDNIHLGMRSLLRQIEQLRQNLEIQRRAVAIAIRRVDVTQEALGAPPPQPGAQFGPTAATDLLTALSDLRNAQNNFMSVWLNYYAARMRLVRELGIMQIDENGEWVQLPIPKSYEEACAGPMEQLPPAVPKEWMEDAGVDPNQVDQLYPPSAEVQQGPQPDPYYPVHRVQPQAQHGGTTLPLWRPPAVPPHHSQAPTPAGHLPQARLSAPVLDR